MVVVRYPAATHGWLGDFLFSSGGPNGATLKHIQTVAEENVLTKLGIPVVVLTAAEFNTLHARYGV